ncbi:MAG: cell division protein ZapA [Lachnospiraceae bacterium]|nr:cell division protein ZapA [Lachnospiraceae bacterium]
MNKRNDVAVVIGGKMYNLGGYESEEYMQKLASYINAKSEELKRQDGYLRMESELKSILMQINIADDYFKAKRNQEETSADAEEKNRENAELRRELIGLQTRLESAEQENRVLREENLELQKRLIRVETELEEIKKH